MIFKDYYKILGFDTNKVTLEQIKIAYREMAKKYHPDMNIDTNNSEEIFKDINEAYRTLSNEKLRRKYDFSWYRYVAMKRKKQKNKKKRTIKEILIDIFFGTSTKEPYEEKKIPHYGENISTKINISIREAFYGTRKQIKLRTIKGKETSFTVQIPAGVQNNDKIRIVGQGRRGSNGGKNGDLLVYVNIINSPNLKLEGTNLMLELPLNTWEAALGTTKTIKVLDEDIKIIIPKSTSSNETLTIKGKGYKNGMGTRGDLHIITKIIMPKKLNDKEIKIYQSLKNQENVKV